MFDARRRVQRHPRGPDRKCQRFTIRARGRWEKWIPSDSTDLARYGSRCARVQPATESEIDCDLPTKGEAICVSRGLERDRVVDETGGQTVVFGRRGSRPFHLDEMERFYRRSTPVGGKNVAGKGELYRVEDVTLFGGVLKTKSGMVLTPLEIPTPSPTPVTSPGEPGVEPSAIPMITPRR